MKITISDIAKECGVNVSTVSRVLNNDSRISRATAEMVMEKVNELGYQPLRKKKNCFERNHRSNSQHQDIYFRQHLEFSIQSSVT